MRYDGKDYDGFFDDGFESQDARYEADVFEGQVGWGLGGQLFSIVIGFEWLICCLNPKHQFDDDDGNLIVVAKKICNFAAIYIFLYSSSAPYLFLGWFHGVYIVFGF